MTDEDNQVIDLWQQQTSEGFRLTSEEIQMNLRKLESKVRVRTRGGYQVCAFLIVAFGTWAFFEHDLLMRLGAAVNIVAIAFLAFRSIAAGSKQGTRRRRRCRRSSTCATNCSASGTFTAASGCGRDCYCSRRPDCCSSLQC